MVYIVITTVVLLFLNVYSSRTSQELIYKSKESAMVERCLIAAADIGKADILSKTTIAEVVSKTDNLAVDRLIVTDIHATVIYDSYDPSSAEGRYALLPEILHSLQGNNTFSWRCQNGQMRSQAAVPIVSYGIITGAVYMMEEDPNQGQLILSLQRNILSISLVLELVLILFSMIFANAFSGRIRKFQSSMRIIRSGDYTHKVDMGGNDELTLLGNEFDDLTERLQVSENKRRQFVSDASHELKTPLASIKLLSDSILQNDMDMDTVREFVHDIGNEAERLNRMSAKLLSLSRIESQEDGDCEIVYMAPTVERVIRMLSAIAKASDVTIVRDIQQDSPVLILEDDLYEILFNLVENGIKYNVSGGSLTIRLLRDEDNALLQVSDTGMGVPEDAVPHLFERFYRVDKARARKSGGSGLGLSIVRNMVERNNGTISVESTLGRGTVFTVTLPVFDTGEDIQ